MDDINLKLDAAINLLSQIKKTLEIKEENCMYCGGHLDTYTTSSSDWENNLIENKLTLLKDTQYKYVPSTDQKQLFDQGVIRWPLLIYKERSFS